ncbi:MAG: CDP-alcohol phosphatidyltransferase family protein [Pedococcus sp.]
MFDSQIRRHLEGPLASLAARVDGTVVTADRVTVAGLVLGLGSAASAASQLWMLALALWLVSRACDGLDGPLARHRASRSSAPAGGGAGLDVGAGPGDPRAPSGSHAGGFLDISSDFVVYGATVVGVAVGATSGEGAAWLPFLLVLLAYYLNGTAFLAFSSIAERADRRIEDGRSLSFLGGLAEGAETIVVHSLWLLLPGSADLIASVWAGVVGLSAAQRMVAGYRSLR